MMTKKITKLAIIGAQNCGKTTSFYYVASSYKMHGRLIGMVHESARDCPYPLNQGAGFLSQWWILSQHIEREAKMLKHYDNVLCDRSVYDGLIYSWESYLLKNMNFPSYNMISRTVYAWAESHPYTALIYLHPLPIEGDSMRGQLSKQQEFQRVIETEFQHLIVSLRRRNQKVEEVHTEDKVERRDTVLEIVRQYFGDE